MPLSSYTLFKGFQSPYYFYDNAMNLPTCNCLAHFLMLAAKNSLNMFAL